MYFPTAPVFGGLGESGGGLWGQQNRAWEGDGEANTSNLNGVRGTAKKSGLGWSRGCLGARKALLGLPVLVRLGNGMHMLVRHRNPDPDEDAHA